MSCASCPCKHTLCTMTGLALIVRALQDLHGRQTGRQAGDLCVTFESGRNESRNRRSLQPRETPRSCYVTARPCQRTSPSSQPGLSYFYPASACTY